ncbi:Lipopolysaccharide kinase (Kdo/WaaP) family protein [Chitinophaga costaii]|uniref:Lipopolysaccharide kinase (Kdo/WaaP) family protein n=1 Tax=Chitinophaga costaii TaxID=1335309 RepID=A0A1C4EZ34_9BACT|nr:lipopolysaccharide kinase InaA family protein [Chitinophaga costaii]PUZ21536.1 lipopolysaccharide kinase [Chitinophaga costaii]SCC48822.1 Lipopolysaccharide kinase (Kdo/WaaP) family protein [Chitinophaga costaii]
MSVHMEIAAQYEFLGKYIEHLPISFNSVGTAVHSGRNIIRIDVQQNVKLVIKSYRQIYIFNRFFYANVVPSKAKRAFLYAQKLLNKGFQTPAPIAYIECVKKGLMRDSYFVSTYVDYQPLRDIYQMPREEALKILDQLAALTWQLHQEGIYHKDYSIGNILFKKNEQGHYDFSLVDNNRMKFTKGSFGDRMKNLRRLDLPLPMLAYFCQQYAKISGENDLLSLSTMLNYRKNRLVYRTRKDRIKHLFKWFLPFKEKNA